MSVLSNILNKVVELADGHRIKDPSLKAVTAIARADSLAAESEDLIARAHGSGSKRRGRRLLNRADRIRARAAFWYRRAAHFRAKAKETARGQASETDS